MKVEKKESLVSFAVAEPPQQDAKNNFSLEIIPAQTAGEASPEPKTVTDDIRKTVAETSDAELLQNKDLLMRIRELLSSTGTELNVAPTGAATGVEEAAV